MASIVETEWVTKYVLDFDCPFCLATRQKKCTKVKSKDKPYHKLRLQRAGLVAIKGLNPYQELLFD